MAKLSVLEKAIEQLESEIAVLVAAKARLLQQRNTAATLRDEKPPRRVKGPKAVVAEKVGA